MNIVESNGDVKLCASTSVKLEVFGCGETFGHCAYKPVQMSHNAYNAYNACNVRKCESAKVRKCESAKVTCMTRALGRCLLRLLCLLCQEAAARDVVPLGP